MSSLLRATSRWGELLEWAPALSFNLYEGKGSQGTLERQFRSHSAWQGLAVDRLLSGGSGGLHLLLAVALLRIGASPTYAVLTLLTAVEQVGVAVLINRRPDLFVRWRSRLHIFNILWSMVASNLHINAIHLNYCRPAGGVLFWLSEFTSASLPWMLLHALVFPLAMPVAIPIHAMSTFLLVTADVLRCQKSLKACPAGGQHFQALQTLLSKNFSVFSANHGAASSAAMASPLTSCVTTYVLAHVFAYVVVMHAVWLCERQARLTFLARTDHYRIEWALERLLPSGNPAIISTLELVVSMIIMSSVVQAAVPAVLAWLRYP